MKTCFQLEEKSFQRTLEVPMLGKFNSASGELLKKLIHSLALVTKRIQMYKFCNSRSMHLYYVNAKPSTPGAGNVLLSQGNDC